MKNFKLFFCLLAFLVPVLSWSQSDNEEIKLIEPIFETDPLDEFQAQNFWKLQTFKNWGIERVGIDSILSVHRGKGVKVCITDTGKPNHNLIKVAGSANFTNDPTDEDFNGHSTHCGGIIAEIAPESQLYFAKVLNNAGGGSMAGVAAGVDWCVDVVGADYISMSLGSYGRSSILKSAITRAEIAGVTVVAAAGNDGFVEGQERVNYPASEESVISVGSINMNVEVSDFSSGGSFPNGDVVAPGEAILSAWPNNQYRVLSGTSMATPFVVGMLAVKQSQTDSFDSKKTLNETAFDLLTPGYDNQSFNGVVSPSFYVPKNGTNPVDPEPSDPIFEMPESKNIGWVIGVGVIFLIGGILFYVRTRNGTESIIENKDDAEESK